MSTVEQPSTGYSDADYGGPAEPAPGARPTVDPDFYGRSARGRIRTLLLATDLSPVSEPATEHAIELAAVLGARLLIVSVIDPSRRPPRGPARIDQQRAELEQPLLGLVGRARARGVEATYLLWTGEPGRSIVAAAEAEGADLLIVGTRGLAQPGRFLLGSVSDYVVYHAACPVLVAR
ncbi:MAG TPA: universal stress protein [Candidatus Limnocylindria bacterium]|nr:universal stress protein [Candidatus Limnocylindria bacterium]